MEEKMNKINKSIFCLFLAGMIVVVFSCQKSESGEETGISNDIKWVRTSVEYQAICIQTYRSAWEAVKNANDHLDEDWAVILDIDETVLDNSPYEEMLIEKGLKYPAQWAEWVNSAEAEAVPGAKAFIDSIRTLGQNAHIAFITNRDISFETATVENLKLRDMWSEDDVVLCRTEKSDTKAIRRNEVVTGTGRCSGTGGWEIIALIGDQLHDVADFAAGSSPEELRNTFKDSSTWGSTSFVLPNPMYGSWINGYK
jgi:5'-nucleotidase (lipoprotein e(P4) family)